MCNAVLVMRLMQLRRAAPPSLPCTAPYLLLNGWCGDEAVVIEIRHRSLGIRREPTQLYTGHLATLGCLGPIEGDCEAGGAPDLAITRRLRGFLCRLQVLLLHPHVAFQLKSVI